MSLLLVRNAPATPGPPLTPVAAVVTLSTSSLRISAAGDAPAGWLSWEIEESTTGTGSWSNISTGPATFDKTGLGSGVTRYYRVRGTTNAGQVSGYSAVASGTTGTAPTGRKWFPGPYIRPDHFGYPNKDLDRFACYDAIQGISGVGALIPVAWGRVNNVQGVYDWTSVQADINRVTANRTNGKKVILSLEFQNYGSPFPSVPQDPNVRILPDWVVAAGLWAWRTSGGVMPKLASTAGMDALLGFCAAVGAAFDSDPYVVGVMVGETSSAYAVADGWDSNGYNTQWLRMPINLKAAFPNTWAFIGNNGLASQAGTTALIDAMVANGIGLQGPDIVNFYGTSAPAFIGNDGAYAMGGVGVWEGYNWGTNDRRTVVPQMFENQVIRSPTLTLAQINDLANTKLKSNFTVWSLRISRSGSYNGDEYGSNPAIPVPSQSGDAVLAFLATAASNVTNTTYPTYT